MIEKVESLMKNNKEMERLIISREDELDEVTKER
jgi:hypothetical protein